MVEAIAFPEKCEGCWYLEESVNQGQPVDQVVEFANALCPGKAEDGACRHFGYIFERTVGETAHEELKYLREGNDT